MLRHLTYIGVVLWQLLSISIGLAQKKDSSVVRDKQDLSAVGPGGYFSVAFELESPGQALPGASASYGACLGAKGRYVIAFQLMGAGISKTEDVNFNVSTIRNARVEDQLKSTSLTIHQQIFGKPFQNSLPYAYLDVGLRYTGNEVIAKYSQYQSIPWFFGGTIGLGYLPNSSTVYTNEQKSPFAGIGVGCFFRMADQAAFFFNLGVKVSQRMEYVENNSLRYDSQGIHVTMENTRPVFFSFSIGIAGRTRYKSFPWAP